MLIEYVIPGPTVICIVVLYSTVTKEYSHSHCVGSEYNIVVLHDELMYGMKSMQQHRCRSMSSWSGFGRTSFAFLNDILLVST